MASTIWQIKGVDTAGAELVLSRIQPWGAEGAVPPLGVSCTVQPTAGAVENLIADDASACTWLADDVFKPGFCIEFTFAVPVDLWGFRFAGPSGRTWPIRHTITSQDHTATVKQVQWVDGALSPAPTKVPLWNKDSGELAPRSSSGVRQWHGCAVSANGRVLLARVNGGNLWMSQNGGETWALHGIVGGSGYGCAASGDGRTLMAGSDGGPLMLSKDGGITWVAQTSVGNRNWFSFAITPDGQNLLAIDYGGTVWQSKDGGATWVLQPTGTRTWYGCAMSPDGQVLVVMGHKSAMSLSKDGGTTWVAQTALGNRDWVGCAVAAGGQVILACDNTGYLWLTKDGGATWAAQTVAGQRAWHSCAASANGQILLASDVSAAGSMWLSTSGGATWVQQPATVGRPWVGCAMSADGETQLASNQGGYMWMQVGIDPIYLPAPIDMATLGVAIALKGDAPLPQALGTITVAESSSVADVEFGGQCSIYGTVELYAQSGNIPLPRRVRLHRSRDGLLVRETWSDAQGNYRFDHISQRYTYDVIAWDHEGLQQSVVANDLTPEVMP